MLVWYGLVGRGGRLPGCAGVVSVIFSWNEMTLLGRHRWREGGLRYVLVDAWGELADEAWGVLSHFLLHDWRIESILLDR